jgi:hypothetical protein
MACITHWYTSLLYFSPAPIIFFMLWLSGRRALARDEREADHRRQNSA